MSSEKEKNNLLEWYDELDENFQDQGMNYQISPRPTHTDEKPEEDKEEGPEKAVDKIEKGAEMHKAMAMVRALDNKLALLSGIFAGFEDEEKKKRLKDQAKEIAKRITDIVNKL